MPTELETCSLRTLAKDNLEIFAKELQGSAEAVAMEFLTILFVFEGDGEVRDLAASGRSFQSYLEGGEDDVAEDDDGSLSLQREFLNFKKTLANAPLGAEKWIRTKNRSWPRVTRSPS